MKGNQQEVEGKVTKSGPSFSISVNTSSTGENAGLALWTPNCSSPGCEEPAGIEGESELGLNLFILCWLLHLTVAF